MMRRARLSVFWLWLLVLAAPVAQADTLEERFQAANSLYTKKRYPEAKAAYEALIERFEVRAAAVYYNLGNTESELGSLGRAILSYKRALDLHPEPDLERHLRDNLGHATDAIVERYRKDPNRSVTVLDETHGVFYSVFHLVPAAVSGLVFLASWAAFFALLMGRRFTEGERAHHLAVAAKVVVVPMLLAGLFFIGRAVTSESVVRGIVIKDNVRLREGRGQTAEESDVPEGLEVRILDASDPGETRIRLSNGKEGWVPAKVVEAI
jgi:hypothetical protein